MSVRRATPDDLPALVDDLWLPFAREMAALDDYHALADDAREEALAHRRRILDREDAACFVAEKCVVEGADAGAEESAEERAEGVSDEAALVGLATVERESVPPVFARGPSAVLHEYYVRPAARGQGLGRRLLAAVESWARDQGCERVTLTVDVANETARSVYDDAGFERFREVRRKSLDN